MKVVVLGAGIIGVCTAWYLLDEGHAVTVVDRQRGAALETSFANGAQISVSYCEPWANSEAPFKIARWLLRDDAPLLFRPRLDPRQWLWGLGFLAECNDRAFERNVAQLVALGRYSHAALKALVAETGIEYHRLERGILHFYSSAGEFAEGVAAARVMRRHGVDRRVLSPAEVLAVEPALAAYAPRLAGGTYTPTDESGDAQSFTAQLAARCAARGAAFLYAHEVLDFQTVGERIDAVRLRRLRDLQTVVEPADAFVAALGSHTAPLLRQTLGGRVDLAIYPTKGYSATLRLLHPDRASVVSLLDDERKLAISRLGDEVRIAGTAELAGYDTSLDTPTARVRCAALVRRYEELFPGVADLDRPRYWAGLRPSTPSNVPCIGRSRVSNLWINAGHGTLGWTHGAGSGKALALLMSGKRPELAFGFYGGRRRGWRFDERTG